MEQRARQKAEAGGKPAEEVKQAKPAAKDQYNFTDPGSRIMMGSDGLVQGYNAQVAVEPALQLIVGQSVTPAANDKEQIEPMVQVIEQQSGQRPDGLLADSGYCSEKNLQHLETADQSGHKIDAYAEDGAAVRRMDRKRSKKMSNADWINPNDPEAEITRLKDGRTALACKAEQAVDMQTGAIVAVTTHGGAAADTGTIRETVCEAGVAVAELIPEKTPEGESKVHPEGVEEVVADKGITATMRSGSCTRLPTDLHCRTRTSPTELERAVGGEASRVCKSAEDLARAR